MNSGKQHPPRQHNERICPYNACGFDRRHEWSRSKPDDTQKSNCPGWLARRFHSSGAMRQRRMLQYTRYTALSLGLLLGQKRAYCSTGPLALANDAPDRVPVAPGQYVLHRYSTSPKQDKGRSASSATVRRADEVGSRGLLLARR